MRSARGEHLVCTLRGRDVAGFVRGDEPAWRTHVWVESADDAAGPRTRAGGTRAQPSRPTSPASAARPSLADPAGAVFTVAEPDPHRGAQVVNEPAAWAMSALSTPDTEAANAFYGAVFGWETDSFGPMTLFRLPASSAASRRSPSPPTSSPSASRARRRGGRRLLGRRRRRRRRASRRARRQRVISPPADDAVGRTRRPRRPAGRARSRSAAWCPHEHDRGRQPRHPRRRHAGAGRPRRGPPRRLRARRLGHRVLRRRPGRVHGRADGPAAAARCCSAAGPTRRCESAWHEAAGGQPGPAGARGAARSTSSPARRASRSSG